MGAVRAVGRRWAVHRSAARGGLAAQLDRALDEQLTSGRPPEGPFVEQVLAARALAGAARATEELPAEPLAVIRATLAARQSRRVDVARRRARVSFQMASAAALVVVVALAVVSSSSTTLVGGSSVKAVEGQATMVLQVLNQNMEEVRESVERGDRAGTESAAADAAQSLHRVQQAAKRLPRGNPVRAKVLEEALDQVNELQDLVTRLQLDVPLLSQGPGAASLTSTTLPSAPSSTQPGPTSGPPAGSGTLSSGPAPASAPAPGPTTTTTGAPAATTTPAPAASEPGHAPTTTTSTSPPLPAPTTTTSRPPTTSTTAPATTTTTTATTLPTTTTTSTTTAATTTTTAPPSPPPVTSTTAPAP